MIVYKPNAKPTGPNNNPPHIVDTPAIKPPFNDSFIQILKPSSSLRTFKASITASLSTGILKVPAFLNCTANNVASEKFLEEYL